MDPDIKYAAILESFQEEIGRHILKFSRFHSALAVHVLLQGPSVQTRVLMRKLIFLEHDIVRHVFRTLVACRGCQQNPTGPGVHVYLEENLETSFTSMILQQVSEVDARDHYCQGLESDSSTSIIPPEQQDGCRSGGSHKLDEDLECDLRQRTKRNQVHVGTAL